MTLGGYSNSLNQIAEQKPWLVHELGFRAVHFVWPHYIWNMDGVNGGQGNIRI